MKVEKPGKANKVATEKDKILAARLGFLRQACNVTLQSLAATHGIQRSNLSAFVTSGGRVRNVAYEKLDRILFTLGLLQDGTLAPKLHRWSITDKEMLHQMSDILIKNQFESALVMRLSSGSASYLAAQVTTNILVFVNIELGDEEMDCLPRELESVADRVRWKTMDRAGDSSIQNLWMMDEDVRVGKLLLSLFQS